MADPAIRRMTVDEFLTWDSGDDRHYELIDGEPVMMAPAGASHQALGGNISGLLHAALKPRAGCIVRIGAGIVPAERGYTYFEVDLAVTCEAADMQRPYLEQPVVLVEILSPSTEGHDRKTKLLSYRRIPSVREILLVDANRVLVELHRREDQRWTLEMLAGHDAVLKLESIGASISLAEIYDRTALAR